MGLFGRLLGWDASQGAFNVVCAERLYQLSDQGTRDRLFSAAIDLVARVQRRSREDIARMLSSQDRKTQLNVIAYAAAEIDVPSPLSGYPWVVEKNPFVSAAQISDDHILAAVKVVSREMGTAMHWPGNSERLTFSA